MRPEDDAPVEMADLVVEAAVGVAHAGRIDGRRVSRRGDTHVIIVILQGRIGDQTLLPSQLVHHAVARVDAKRAGDALELLPVAYIDAHRTHRDAGVAIHAIANRLSCSDRLLGVA